MHNNRSRFGEFAYTFDNSGSIHSQLVAQLVVGNGDLTVGIVGVGRGADPEQDNNCIAGESSCGDPSRKLEPATFSLVDRPSAATPSNMTIGLEGSNSSLADVAG